MSLKKTELGYNLMNGKNDPITATEHEMLKRFDYHAPKNDSQIRRYKEIRSKALILALELEELCPDSREKSLAITKLEEMVFWANASIARNE